MTKLVQFTAGLPMHSCQIHFRFYKLQALPDSEHDLHFQRINSVNKLQSADLSYKILSLVKPGLSLALAGVLSFRCFSYKNSLWVNGWLFKFSSNAAPRHVASAQVRIVRGTNSEAGRCHCICSLG